MIAALRSPASEEDGALSVTLVFLGRLEDVAGGGKRSVPLSASVDAVIDSLEPELAEALRAPKVRLAVNGVLLREKNAPILRDGDEIAFLPPVSGG